MRLLGRVCVMATLRAGEWGGGGEGGGGGGGQREQSPGQGQHLCTALMSCCCPSCRIGSCLMMVLHFFLLVVQPGRHGGLVCVCLVRVLRWKSNC